MKKLIVLSILLLFVISGCTTNMTGYASVDVKDSLNACIEACARCNPKSLTPGCQDSCNQYLTNGGLLKLERYIELYSNKCQKETVETETISNE